jgi:hypothetical protein|tara:strand:+ start:78 stop:329 length:252 start_codon:yes stop_codon:yes gene_type:complete
MKDPEKFFEEAQKGIVTVVFEKLHTKEIRTMPCTLNSDFGDFVIEIKKYDPKSDHYVVWCTDKDAWRSFRVSTVKEWYVGEPK